MINISTLTKKKRKWEWNIGFQLQEEYLDSALEKCDHSTFFDIVAVMLRPAIAACFAIS